MLRLLLNALLALVAARFLFGLFRWMGDHPEDSGRGSRRDRDDAAGPAGQSHAGTERSQEGMGPRGAARPGVDRSAVIDVTFTEEEPGAPTGSAAGAPTGSAAAGPDREVH